MRTTKILRQMAGLTPTPYDKAMARHKRDVDRRVRAISIEMILLEAIERRQRGDEGTAPMPFKTMRADLEKMAKGEL
jgi:hypothetical protein